MTDGTTPPLDEIRGLLAERERFETWLTTLEARRSATPPHVFDRVWQDYDARRARVDEALGGHAPILQRAADAMAARHAEVSRSLDERRDALAEVELRALVGEYDEAQGESLRAEAQAAIETLEQESGSVEGELTDVRALLTQTQRSVAAPMQASMPMREPELSTGSVSGPGSDPGDRRAEDDTPPGTRDAGGSPGTTDSSAGMPGAGDPRDGRDSRSGPAFAGQGLASSAFGATPADPTGDARFGTSAQKTLRCPECSAMNFPTEWYCERCGGELAAL